MKADIRVTDNRNVSGVIPNISDRFFDSMRWDEHYIPSWIRNWKIELLVDGQCVWWRDYRTARFRRVHRDLADKFCE